MRIRTHAKCGLLNQNCDVLVMRERNDKWKRVTEDAGRVALKMRLPPQTPSQ